MKTLRKIAISTLSLLLVLLIVYIFVRMPIEKQTKQYEDISLTYDNNKYEVTIQETKEKILVKEIEVRYVNGYVSKYGRKATLKEDKIKTILGGEYHKYTLIIIESVN